MRLTLPRESYLPKPALCAVKLDSATGEGCAYVWSEDRAGKVTYLAKGFSGKSNKPRFFYSYRTVEQRDENVAKFLSACDATATYKAERKAKVKAEKAALDCRVDLPIGTIMVSSWGYDQTNVDFFQVTEHISRTRFVVRPIGGTMTGATGPMAGMFTATPDAFHGEPMTVTLSAKDRFRRPDLSSDQCAHKWDGRPTYCSWYA